MESTSSEEEGSTRDNNVDLNDENMEHHMGLESEVVVLAKSGTVNRDKSATPANLKPQLVESVTGFSNPPPNDQELRTDTKEVRQYAFGVEDSQGLLEFAGRDDGGMTLSIRVPPIGLKCYNELILLFHPANKWLPLVECALLGLS
ncbi:hypothetical protein J5N97_018926 [Dioscorea zingiberensis]|uniref:Uncharacterized protein n=1 Tax=Dioscorea zingiberensis TaxID=325984 RepID=A0A9D5HC80_9LILI|nr:hypothetical protein J5N97_018926 [Dioscorea zingiberensis]